MKSIIYYNNLFGAADNIKSNNLLLLNKSNGAIILYIYDYNWRKANASWEYNWDKCR